MKRRAFLSLWALPLAVALPAVASKPQGPRIVSELFETLDFHHQVGIAVTLSDGTRHGLRMGRLCWARYDPGRRYARFPEQATVEEKMALREAMNRRLGLV